MPTALDPQHRFTINALWLVRLRWVAVFGQLITIAVAAWVLRVELPLGALFAVVGAAAATNVAFAVWLVRRLRAAARQASAGHRPLAAIMVLDLALLTALLYFTGGPENPFSLFYLVNLSLAAMVLPPRITWALAGLALASLVGLGFFHVPLRALLEPTDAGRPELLRQWGVLVAIATCAAVVVYFVTRLTGELRDRERQLREIEEQRQRNERLEALATLAAGAAHELGTPLSTIAVVSKELGVHLSERPNEPFVAEDLALIRSEVEHCRQILGRLSGSVGQAVGGRIGPVSVSQIVQETLGGLRSPQRVQVDIGDGASAARIVAPLEAVAQAIRAVVQNAIDASPAAAPVELAANLDGERARIVIQDRGSGMPPAVLARATEPFFTTKGTGHGMGLGLHLAKSVVERLGGVLRMESTAGQGSTVTIELPVRSGE